MFDGHKSNVKMVVYMSCTTVTICLVLSKTSLSIMIPQPFLIYFISSKQGLVSHIHCNDPCESLPMCDTRCCLKYR